MLQLVIQPFKKRALLCVVPLMAAAAITCAQEGQSAQEDFNLPDLGSTSATISSGAEYRLGRAWLRQFRAYTETWQDPITQTYIESLISRLVPYSEVTDRVLVTMIPSAQLNAFAVPGGVVGVNAGLFAYAPQEDEFASVIAHELGHLAQRHFARRMARAEETQLPTMAAMLAGMIIAASGGGEAGIATMMGSQAAFIQDQLTYSRRFEQEADRMGLHSMSKAGFDPQAMPKLFRQLLKYASLQGGNPPEFLLTHPLTQSRISDVQARADQLPTPKPSDTNAYLMSRARALLWIYRSDPDHAMTVFSQDNPSDAAVRYLKAMIAAQKNQPAEALNELDALASQFPDLSMIPATAAQIAYDANDRQDALNRAERILRYSPDYFPAQWVKAQALVQLDANKAFDFLRLLSERQSENPAVFSLLAEAAGRSGHETWGLLARSEQLQLNGSIDSAIKQIDFAIKRATGNQDFAFASRLEKRREEYIGYRETLDSF